ncbi:MAG: poly(A) polymerase [Planctomycetota bacterium]|jgi:poly(A) polymerase
MRQNHSSNNPNDDRGEAEGLVIEADDILSQIKGENSLRVISRLQRSGYEAFLVGGCVRDLLVGLKPKDFDVATSAHPRQVRRLFPRNSHIIGRRFRLVHIRYGPTVVIETATFRAEPQAKDSESDDLLIVEDNTYGTAIEDARRRDFTVNGLLLDPTRSEIIDYVGGLQDLEDGVLRTIGDPDVRIPEDPVRILRAIKFATRLGFHIEDRTWNAMCECSEELSRSAPPRVLEEILKLLRSGSALGAFQKLRQCGALAVILPELDEHLGPLEDQSKADLKRAASLAGLLEALDAQVHDGFIPSTPVCLAILYYDMVERQADTETRTLPGPPPDFQYVTGEVLENLTGNSRISRRDAGRTRRIIFQQKNFLGPFGRRFRPRLFCLAEEFRESLDLFRLRTEARGEGWDIYKAWEERYRDALEMEPDQVEGERKQARRGRRKRRPRR